MTPSLRFRLTTGVQLLARALLRVIAPAGLVTVSCNGMLGGAPGPLFVRASGEAPAWHAFAVCPVGLVELRVENWLLVENYEEVKENENVGRVLEDGCATEKPCLAQQNGQNAVVHGVTGVTVKAAYDEMPRWIDWRQCAFAPGKEVPDAAEMHDDAGEGEDAGRNRGATEFRQMKAARSEEDSIWHVADQHSRQ